MRTWAEINLDALEHNIKEIRRITNKSSKIMAIVKADAYGHGFLEVARTLVSNGADAFAVALIDEGLQLRRKGFTEPILVLGPIPEEDYVSAIQNNIMMSVFSLEVAKKISKLATALDLTAKIHIKLDTGMARVGYVVDGNDDGVIDEILAISKLPSIKIDGIFSHFATADEADEGYTKMQFKRFIAICEKLNELGLTDFIRHIANSAAIMMYPETHLDMVRPGIILYGLYPSEDVCKTVLNLIPAMTLKTKITHIKQLPPGYGVSYGKEYITDSTKTIATVPIGYADGYLRGISAEGRMLLKNQKVKILGRICMDQCMIDVTNVNNINIGDEVILFSDKIITADDLASWLGTINYEVICMISKRIPRVYMKGGEAVKELNFLKC